MRSSAPRLGFSARIFKSRSIRIIDLAVNTAKFLINIDLYVKYCGIRI